MRIPWLLIYHLFGLITHSNWVWILGRHLTIPFPYLPLLWFSIKFFRRHIWPILTSHLRWLQRGVCLEHEVGVPHCGFREFWLRKFRGCALLASDIIMNKNATKTEAKNLIFFIITSILYIFRLSSRGRV